MLKILLLALAAPLIGCASTRQAMTSPRPPHHTDSGFRNLYLENNSQGLGDVIKWKWSGDKVKWTSERVAQIPRVKVDQQRLAHPNAEGQLTWLGHATVLFQAGDKTIITDPVFSQRVSPVGFAGPKRFTQPALSIEELPKLDIAVISHNHYDHLDSESVERIGDQVHWVVPLGHRDWFEDLGITRITELDWWQSVTIDGVTLTATPTQHWSGRGLFDRFDCLWASWLIEANGVKFWFGGDTGYNPHQFKEIGERFGPIDLAAIPIGAYEPRWFMKDMHINPAEAALIYKEIGAKRAIGIHWGTFQLTDEGPMEPPFALQKAKEKQEIPAEEFQAIPIGATF